MGNKSSRDINLSAPEPGQNSTNTNVNLNSGDGLSSHTTSSTPSTSNNQTSSAPRIIPTINDSSIERSTPSSDFTQLLSNLFSNTSLASSVPSSTTASGSTPNGRRYRVIENNGNYYAYLGSGKIVQLQAAQKCPYCEKMVHPLKEEYEVHLVKCMTKPRVKTVQFEVEENSELIGEECTICFEEYEQGQICSRLECLCVYHKVCLDNWLSRKQCCPLHIHSEEDKKEDS